jgi:hypothetical protein
MRRFLSRCGTGRARALGELEAFDGAAELVGGDAGVAPGGSGPRVGRRARPREGDAGSCRPASIRHAWEAHGIDFSVELALEVVRRAEPVPSSERNGNGAMREEKQ